MYNHNTFNQSQKYLKIQLNHFSAYLNFTDLLITPKELPQKRIAPQYQ